MRLPLALPASVSLVLALVACGGGGSTDRVDAADFTANVAHPFLRIEAGREWVYEGEEDGQFRRVEIRALPDPELVGTVSCIAVVEDTFLDGVRSETTTEWFAQDVRGNVWRFGEETLEFDGVGFVRSADSWRAGEDGARAWISLAATLRVGDTFKGFSPSGDDLYVVLAVGGTAVVPAGTFVGCATIAENPDDPEDQDIILYAPRVGVVSETSTTGHIELVSYR